MSGWLKLILQVGIVSVSLSAGPCFAEGTPMNADGEEESHEQSWNREQKSNYEARRPRNCPTKGPGSRRAAERSAGHVELVRNLEQPSVEALDTIHLAVWLAVGNARRPALLLVSGLCPSQLRILLVVFRDFSGAGTGLVRPARFRENYRSRGVTLPYRRLFRSFDWRP